MKDTRHPLNWTEPEGKEVIFGPEEIPNKPTQAPMPPTKTKDLQKKVDEQLEWYLKNKEDNPELNRDYATMLTNLNK